MKKVAFILIITALSIGGSGFVLDHMLAKHGGIGYISSAIEAMRLRSAKPGMPPEMIAAEAAKANKGAMGLLKTLADGGINGLGNKAGDSTDSKQAGSGDANKAQDNDVYIRVSENHDAMLKSQLAASGPQGEIKGATDSVASTRQVSVEGTADGREVVGVIHDASVEDHNAVDRINAMNIPDDLREKILKNYYATGVLPEILVKEKRKPTSKPGDPDDPYNPQNF